eukprot:313930-Pelagomonas_calceolata.AAC.7
MVVGVGCMGVVVVVEGGRPLEMRGGQGTSEAEGRKAGQQMCEEGWRAGHQMCVEGRGAGQQMCEGGWRTGQRMCEEGAV